MASTSPQRPQPSHALRCLLLATATAFTLSGCAQYATVAEKRPRFLPRPPGTGILANAERSIATALRVKRDKPLIALGGYLEALQAASDELRRDPANSEALRDYNFALERIFTVIREARIDPWKQPLHVPGPGGGYELTYKPDPRPQWRPGLYEFIPADQLDIGGTYMTKREVKAGIGAPLVARQLEFRTDYREDFANKRIHYGVTALAEFSGRRCVLSFTDPLTTEQVRVAGHSFPLAADFSAPLAMLLVEAKPKRFELARLLNPGKFAETARISRLQPYDPDKTVVLFVHGLADTPATWTPLLNSLRADPEIRKNCQFWLYSYPSGYPYPYSAAIMRRELDAITKRYPIEKPMVLIGHSMGGMISRLMITDSHDKIWMGIFGEPPDRVTLTPGSREILTESCIFKHRPEIGSVIFIASPHRGSDLASNWIGRFASGLVRAPSTLLKVSKDLLHVATLDQGAMKLRRIPNSVDTLSPNNRFVKLVNTIPITPGIPYHTIVGDRGKGGTPNSSDGVVPYWSSHLEGAKSELVVPSNHSAHQNPQAIEEVKRILTLHARQ